MMSYYDLVYIFLFTDNLQFERFVLVMLKHGLCVVLFVLLYCFLEDMWGDSDSCTCCYFSYLVFNIFVNILFFLDEQLSGS